MRGVSQKKSVNPEGLQDYFLQYSEIFEALFESRVGLVNEACLFTEINTFLRKVVNLTDGNFAKFLGVLQYTVKKFNVSLTALCMIRDLNCLICQKIYAKSKLMIIEDSFRKA